MATERTTAMGHIDDLDNRPGHLADIRIRRLQRGKALQRLLRHPGVRPSVYSSARA